MGKGGVAYQQWIPQCMKHVTQGDGGALRSVYACVFERQREKDMEE